MHCSLLRLLPWPWLAAAALAAPYVPDADERVLERVPARATDARARELLQLRAAWRAAPADIERALPLAQRLFEQGVADGDPRPLGQAQAVLAPWWTQPAPPPALRTLRAALLQYQHRFADALADLHAAVRADPDAGDAWAWITAIELVRGELAAAREACARLAVLAPPTVGAGCRAQVDFLGGRADAAARELRAALAADAAADADARRWALTRLGEIEHHRGATVDAERAFRDALALGAPDVYLLAALADLLLDAGRPAEVLKLLDGRARADVLLLRLAIAARAAGDPRAARWADELAARFDAARARGDATHRKEESRFVLALRGDAPRALELARLNWAEQREPADARILLEAALAARQPRAAEPVLQWIAATGVRSRVLDALAARLKGAS